MGPTASGKTRLSLALAAFVRDRGRGVEVINADAMQRYRGMDIGTAKVSAAERGQVAHHELDVLDPADEASVRDYQRTARATAAQIRARGALPLYVGGSGLYLRAALDELDIPPTDDAVRARIEERLAAVGAAALHQELRGRDPSAAQAIAVANSRRVVRALEVIELTGRPFSATRPEAVHHVPTIQVGLTVSAEVLSQRIDQRSAQMLREGLIEEAGALRDRGWGRTAASAVGYPQALRAAQGAVSRAETAAEISAATRKLAKRQMTWFRSDQRTHWLHADDMGHAAMRAMVEHIAGLLHHRASDCAQVGAG
ncbi:tRNA (adenosine(37)-N6)-dimethylallyltransferase MiaA [Paracoccus sp. (in: a-proteobacteria)]|uniref:tRNA (adenosine(37)-N6)-dimethylallyltransferase MiaA n=1 Tax=Paracoccus sp. TaxID=267 RepID=UPI0026DEAD72|nr:tRNA (adenosine(37)-N6)-dimethylallyltransferase MiaA [Paracoccus sp. (in: a-proteobacteria)]MDO5371725.1 tRNA (adenosine(37)-N6)-dimethylallyltransferase MiaA [Paracoccus sp. (in: a-proteobacteria)]